jgi:hypothetical protein
MRRLIRSLSSSENSENRVYLLWKENSDRSRCHPGKPGAGRRRRKTPSSCGFDPIRPRNVVRNCLTEFSAVWAYKPSFGTKPPSMRALQSRGKSGKGSPAQSSCWRSIRAPIPRLLWLGHEDCLLMLTLIIWLPGNIYLLPVQTSVGRPIQSFISKRVEDVRFAVVTR